MNKENLNKLKELYLKNSKHSQYQLLPNKLKEILDINESDIKSRYESERLIYILKNINIYDKHILDIGGNSGYFTFEFIENGAKSIDYYEINKEHSEFVKLTTKILGLESKIKINNMCYNFRENLNKIYDITLLLNVLHHIGDDFGDKYISMNNSKNEIIESLNLISQQTDILVFQLGFNWKGNRNNCLFENGTKKELINFIKENTKDSWDIINIGIAESINNKIIYNDLNDSNIERNDSIGEFLNRPIFIMKSKKVRNNG